MNDLFISMEYNDREVEGIDDFKKDLEKDYQFQLRPKWIASYSEGGEFWMTIFINSEIGGFLVSAIAGGIAWDLIKVGAKNYVFEPFFRALEKLNLKNENNGRGLNVLKLKFQFDDCAIFVGGLNKNFTSVLSSIFQEISKRKPRFEEEVGQEVIKIELPIEVDQREGIDKKYKYSIDTFNEVHTPEAYLKLWKLTFTTDFPVMLYNFQYDTLKEI